MKNPIIFIFFLILVYSCGERTTHYYISEENKPLLVNNDTIIYIDSATQNTDTFRMYISDNFESRENSISEYIVIRYFNQNKSKVFKEFYIMHWYLDAVDVSVDSYDFEDILSLTEIQSVLIKNNVDIRGTIYPTVFVLKPKSDVPDSLPNTVYFTFKYGIVRYEYKDGRTYEIMNDLMVK